MKHYLLATLLLLGIATLKAQDQTNEPNNKTAQQLTNPLAAIPRINLQTELHYWSGSTLSNSFSTQLTVALPLKLSDRLNFIVNLDQTVYRIRSYDQIVPGYSDALVTTYFTKRVNDRDFTWGVGPAVILPTGTDHPGSYYDDNRFGAGISATANWQKRGFNYGLIARHIRGEGEINVTTAQAYLSYTWKPGIGLRGDLTTHTNWSNESTNVYFSPAFNATTNIGKVGIQFSLGPNMHLGSFKGTANWGINGGLTIFPSRKR